MAKRFRAVLEQSATSTSTAVTIPFDVLKAFGKRGRVAVRGTIDGVPFRSSIFRMGDNPYFMVINRRMRDRGGLAAGQTVSIVMDRDDEARAVDVPSDLQQALDANADARAAWIDLSFTHQREYVEAVEAAKRSDTRERRIAKTIEQLASRA